MKNSTSTTAIAQPRYGHHLRLTSNKQPRPRVYTTASGYRIEPWHYANGGGTDNLEAVLDAMKPLWLRLTEVATMLVPPVYFVLTHFAYKKYERKFWIANGFDPDSFV